MYELLLYAIAHLIVVAISIYEVKTAHKKTKRTLDIAIDNANEMQETIYKLSSQVQYLQSALVCENHVNTEKNSIVQFL